MNSDTKDLSDAGADTAARTPGDWRTVDGRGQYAHEVWSETARGTPVTVCRIASGRRHREADAQIIAAAPDLLAACRAAAQWLHDNCEDDEPLRQVRQAIAKAEGR